MAYYSHICGSVTSFFDIQGIYNFGDRINEIFRFYKVGYGHGRKFRDKVSSDKSMSWVGCGMCESARKMKELKELDEWMNEWIFICNLKRSSLASNKRKKNRLQATISGMKFVSNISAMYTFACGDRLWMEGCGFANLKVVSVQNFSEQVFSCFWSLRDSIGHSWEPKIRWYLLDHFCDVSPMIQFSRIGEEG